MPAPSTIAEFLELARKSGVLDEKRLEAHVEKLRQANALPPEPNKLAGILVRDGLLTMFQAEQLVQGKWRRFTIGRYKVLERLGAGGMGSVYLCEHVLMRRRVAVKILPNQKSEDQSAIERFHREARVVAALDHPNIVRAYDADEADGLHFLVMEHVDGASFQDIIKKHGPMDVLRACHYMHQAALGLQHAHEKAAIVHRDVKPGNILIDRYGVVKILDMGLARFFHDEQDALTRKYDENVLGTADYLSPEQAEDSHTVDIRTDLYSLGGTFYYLLTGQPPFAEGSVAQKLIWHQTRQPKPISAYRGDVPEGVIQVINIMMAKNRDQRYPTPLDVAQALEPFTQNPIPPPPEHEMPQLSPAAMGVTYSPVNSEPVTPPSGRGKGWQVNTAGSTASSAEPVTKPSSRPPGAGPAGTPPTPAPVVVAPTRPAAKQGTPDPAAAPTPPKSAPKSAPRPAPAKPASARPAPVAKAPGSKALGSKTAPPAPPPAPTPAPGPAAAQPPRVPGTPLLQAAPLPPAAPTTGEENGLDWGQLDTSDGTARLDTAPPSSRRRPGRTSRIDTKKDESERRRRLLLLIAGIGTTVALIVGLVLWLVFHNLKPATSASASTATEPQAQTWYVGRDADYSSIQRIGDRLKPGDRIVIRGPSYEEQLSNPKYLNGVTIEAEGEVVWRRPANKPDKAYLIYLVNAKNVRFKGFTFDGGGQTESLVGLTGDCSGLTFENIQLLNPTKAGFLFLSCEGAKDHPVTLTNITMTNATVPPVQFEMGAAKKKNDHIHLDECDFKGPNPSLIVVGDSIGPDVTHPANVTKQNR